MGTIRRVPVADDTSEVSVSHQMVLALTFDHAFVDSAPAAAFLQHLDEAFTG